MRSEKPVLVRREVRREILSEDQVDIQKYLGLQLSEVEERKTRGQWIGRATMRYGVLSSNATWATLKKLTNYQTV